MCLAIPGKITSINEQTHLGKVDFDGVVRDVPLDLVAKAQVGDYVLVHAGFAIEVMSASEAQKTLDILNDMKAVEDEVANIATAENDAAEVAAAEDEAAEATAAEVAAAEK